MKHIVGALMTVCSVFVTQAAAAPVVNIPGETVTLPARELRQLQDDWQRGRTNRQMREFEQRAPEQAMPEADRAQSPASGFRFTVKSIGHTPSQVLTDAEFDEAVAAWVGRSIRAEEIADMLDAVNARYRARGYVVCQAVVKPQRIRNGHLEITLLEGRTERTIVSGNDTTNEDYITAAFDFREGEVANYRDMIDALVRFNMTNDVALKIDIGPGETPMGTVYRIQAQEPERWVAAVFGDTSGSKSTGRPRIGASLTNRSVFGIRDTLTVLALASEGSKSGMIGYTLPITPQGTKVSGMLSYGSVDVVDGPAADLDVSGDSTMASLRLEHPVYVTSQSKYTLWGEVARQVSKSDMFGDIRISDTAINSFSAGLDVLAGADNTLLAGSAYLSRHLVNEREFDKKSSYTLFNGNVTARRGFDNGFALTLAAHWQSVLGGDALNSADYFYLGHINGVRGYDNDIVCAEAGFAASVEAGYPIAGERSWLYAFFDAGRLSGERISAERELYSVGAGLIWPLFEGAHLNVTASFPLKRKLDDDIEVSSARADLAVVVTW